MVDELIDDFQPVPLCPVMDEAGKRALEDAQDLVLEAAPHATTVVNG